MAPEGNRTDAPDRTIGDRIVHALDQTEKAYESLKSSVRTYSPMFVRTIEVLLGLGLIVGLGYWAYTFYLF